MNEFTIKKNDTRPEIKVQLRNENNEPKNISNLNAQAVTFHMESVDDGSVVVDDVGSIVSGENGIVAYEWSTNDTQDVGRYKAEFEVTYDDGGVETFPNGDNIDVVIRDDIA